MFGRKKKINKDSLFGASIEPNCAHCLNSVTVQGEARCRIGQILTDGKCKKFMPLRESNIILKYQGIRNIRMMWK